MKDMVNVKKNKKNDNIYMEKRIKKIKINDNQVVV